MRAALELTITVHVGGHLRGYATRSEEVYIQGAKDVLDVIKQLDAKFPSIRDRVLDEHDKTRPYINIFVNDENARDLQGEATRLRDGDVIYILPSVAGGMG